MLGKQPSNSKSIEPQLINRFLADNCAYSFEYPAEYKKELASIVIKERLSGSVSDTLTPDLFKLPLKYKKGVLDSDCIEALQTLLCKIHPSTTHCEVNSVYEKYSSLTLHGKVFDSVGTKSSRVHYVIQAKWVEELYGKPPTPLPVDHHPLSNHRPIVVHHYLKVFYSIDNTPDLCNKLFAYVSWLFPHPERHAYGKPAELWCNQLYESFGSHSFIPLEGLVCRCAHVIVEHNSEHLSLIVPLVE